MFPYMTRNQAILLTLACVAPSLLWAGCKKNAADNYVHVDVYGQMNSRYEPLLAARFRSFSHDKATLPTGRKIVVGEVLEANYYDNLANPEYRAKAQMLVLNSEQEAAVDPNLAAEFVHARKGCTVQIPCYLLIPNSVSGEQRDAAQQLLDYLAPATASSPAAPAPAATPQS